MVPLKIGVLTYHRCINYGSYWQARCLAEGLQLRGHMTCILDHESARVNIAEWKCALQPVLPLSVPRSDHKLYREKIKGFFKVFDTLPLSARFPLDEPEQMESYDVVVVGSDEVWNLSHPWYGANPLFYGDGIKAERLISYAASFGNYASSWGLDQKWADKLRNFDSISVRDENSKHIIENIVGVDAEMVLDPCLQFSIHAERRQSAHWQKPFVAVYGHNFSPSYVRKVQSWARKRDLPLVSIGYRNDWADEQWITADPHDFAHSIARSEAVVTNFFHGCIFALRNEKPFVCETSPYRSYKVNGLMMKIGGEMHLVADATPAAVLESHLNNPVNPRILQKIARLRESSNEYLDAALSLKQLKYA